MSIILEGSWKVPGSTLPGCISLTYAESGEGWKPWKVSLKLTLMRARVCACACAHIESSFRLTFQTFQEAIYYPAKSPYLWGKLVLEGWVLNLPGCFQGASRNWEVEGI